MKRKEIKRTDAHRHGLSCLSSGLKSWCSGAESLEMWLSSETGSFKKAIELKMIPAVSWSTLTSVHEMRLGHSHSVPGGTALKTGEDGFQQASQGSLARSQGCWSFGGEVGAFRAMRNRFPLLRLWSLLSQSYSLEVVPSNTTRKGRNQGIFMSRGQDFSTNDEG